jgi:hypothetical protein
MMMKKLLAGLSIMASAAALTSTVSEAHEHKNRRQALKHEIEVWKYYGDFCDMGFFASAAYSAFSNKYHQYVSRAYIATACGSVIWRLVVKIKRYQIGDE